MNLLTFNIILIKLIIKIKEFLEKIQFRKDIY